MLTLTKRVFITYYCLKMLNINYKIAWNITKIFQMLNYALLAAKKRGEALLPI